jgi:cephalosporin hydroxylase
MSTGANRTPVHGSNDMLCAVLAQYDLPCQRLPWTSSQATASLFALGRLWSREDGSLGKMKRALCKGLGEVRLGEAARGAARDPDKYPAMPCEMLQDLAPSQTACSTFNGAPTACVRCRVGNHRCVFNERSQACRRDEQKSGDCVDPYAFGFAKFAANASASQLPSMGRLRELCESPPPTDVPAESIAREKVLKVVVNRKLLTVDDILHGYELLFQRRLMYSAVTSQRVGMQLDPLDAFAIADLLWRVRPRIVVELGTSGGGSALYYARTMLGYDPHARVLTMDPATDTRPLENWNAPSMNAFCPHCLRANSTGIWAKAVTYLRALPPSARAIGVARRLVEEHARPPSTDGSTSPPPDAGGLPVLVVEDSNHAYAVVRANLWAYWAFVTPGSYLIVQDTRLGRYGGVARAISEFLTTGPGKGRFVRDRRPEYFLFSQHSGGFLRRLAPGEVLGEWDQPQ